MNHFIKMLEKIYTANLHLPILLALLLISIGCTYGIDIGLPNSKEWLFFNLIFLIINLIFNIINNTYFIFKLSNFIKANITWIKNNKKVIPHARLYLLKIKPATSNVKKILTQR